MRLLLASALLVASLAGASRSVAGSKDALDKRSPADVHLAARQNRNGFFGNRNGGGGRNGENNNAGAGGGATATNTADGATDGGTTAANGTVVDQAQEGDAATAADGQDGQGQNATAAAAADNAGGGAAGNAQGKAPPANIVDTGDPQKNLFLDDSQVAKGLALDGQQVPADNQVASATSVNNFINSCLLRTDLPLTNGNQVITGSCNAVPMGVIGAADKAPSSKFISPKNLDVIAPDTTFTAQMKINNLVTGNFVNAQQNYFSAPQATDNNGIIIGHSHVVIEQIDALTSTAVTDPQEFAFFKGLNEAAQGGVLSATVDGGLAEGTYKMSSINSAANHQPALIGVAQHGSLDDAVYFVVSNDPNAVAAQLGIQGQAGGAANNDTADAGDNAGNGNAGAGQDDQDQDQDQNQNQDAGQDDGAAAGGGAAGGAATTTTTSAAAAATTSAAAQGGGGGRGGRFGGGGGRGGGFFGDRGNNNRRLSRLSRTPKEKRPRAEDSVKAGSRAQSLLQRRLEALLAAEEGEE
ncbi:hypothetical protein JCM10207_008562 [Rhodosporidiobolus poonsookiae]